MLLDIPDGFFNVEGFGRIPGTDKKTRQILIRQHNGPRSTSDTQQAQVLPVSIMKFHGDTLLVSVNPDPLGNYLLEM